MKEIHTDAIILKDVAGICRFGICAADIENVANKQTGGLMTPVDLRQRRRN